ncbi:MAG: VWA domain-containing protein [Leptonema sp. (in: Bacteria)]|nr:VWA domain-containing protein [Leptonema sp. (in: bacteria)]
MSYRSYSLVFVYALAISFGKPTLSAQSVDSATVDAAFFPDPIFELPASLLTFQPKSDTIRFTVRESAADSIEYPGRIKKVQVPTVKLASDQSGLLYAVVIDATKSVPPTHFKKSIQAAQSLVDNMPEEAQMAVFRINGKPTQLQSFTSNRKSLNSTLKKLSRTGKVTRIYDSLFYALRETSAVAKKNKAKVGGLILFTDGRDEGSYLTEQDCIDIAAKGHDLEIPIFVVLNGSAKNERLFKRLALRSGGELFKLKVNFDELESTSARSDEPEAKQLDQVEHLQIRYTSLLPFWKAWPGSQITVNAYYDDQLLGTTKYTVPGIQSFIGAHPVVFGLLLLLFFTFIGLIVWLFLFIRRRNFQEEETEPKLNIPESHAQPYIEQYGDVFIDMRDPEYNAPIELGKIVETESKIDSVTQTQLPRQKFENEAITLNMKEKAYMVLQMALKEAPVYNLGVLIRKTRDMNRMDQRYDLFLDETYIGNGPSATLPTQDQALANIHAKVRRINKKYVLFDLGGRAGTFLNGKKVLRPMPLRSGDEIRMGHSLFIFQGEG